MSGGELWPDTHSEALQRLYKAFEGAMAPCGSSHEFESSLRRLKWPDGPPSLTDSPGVAVQKTFTSLLRAKKIREASRRKPTQIGAKQ